MPRSEDFAAAVGPRTAIIPTLNGMRHIDVLAKRFGEETVAGGVCKAAATIDTEGRARALRRGGEVGRMPTICFCTSVSMTPAFYGVPAGAAGMAC